MSNDDDPPTMEDLDALARKLWEPTERRLYAGGVLSKSHLGFYWFASDRAAWHDAAREAWKLGARLPGAAIALLVSHRGDENSWRPGDLDDHEEVRMAEGVAAVVTALPALLAHISSQAERVRELEAEAEANAWRITPAMAQAAIDGHVRRIAELEAGLGEACDRMEHTYRCVVDNGGDCTCGLARLRALLTKEGGR